MALSRSSDCFRLVFVSVTSLLIALNIGISFHHASVPTSSVNSEMLRQFVQPPPPPAPHPLNSILQGWNITGDASWLLDFAIIGFPKCGTSTLMFHLLSHPEVKIFKDERCELAWNRQAILIRDLYLKFSPGSSFVRGIKCPGDLENTKLSLPNYQKFFPKTSYIIGIRHPVLW